VLGTLTHLRLVLLSRHTGNVAWAHLCTKNRLKTNPKDVSGLPIFITDDTPVTDAVRFTQRVNMDMEIFKIKPTSWSVPFLFCYLLAMLLEFVLRVVNVFTKVQVEYCPRGTLSFGSSLVLYDRLRSAISAGYEPMYTVAEAFTRSAKWYDSWYENFASKKRSPQKP
jgi:3beta-hydroxy-Delta5-steroid dehydrogenase / steroid Delta-isomerase